MKKISLCAALLASAVAAQAQNNTAAKFAKYITAEDARRHLSIIASDEFEGRETGKPGAEKAANYIAAEFKKLGLQAPVNGSYFLNIPLVETSSKINAFTVNGTSYTFGKDFYATGPSTNSAILSDDIVFVGYATEEELSKVNIANKIILMISGTKPATAGAEPEPLSRAARTQLAKRLADKQPAMVLSVNNNLAAILKRMGGNTGSGRLEIKKEDAPMPPPIMVSLTPEIASQLLKNSGKTYAQLKAAADAGNATEVLKAQLAAAYNTVRKEVKAVDVLGYMPGSDPKLKNEVLVFSGHYDHIGLNPSGPDKVNNGADDDGSGTTGVLEIARAFSMAKKAGKGPRRSILFLGNVGEEKGLLGSEYYTDHPVFPLANTIADLNIDMIGRIGFEYQNKPDSANSVYVIGSAMLSSDLRKISEAANNQYTKLKLDYKYDDPNDPNQFYYRSDHYNFAKHGVPIIFYFNGVHQDYHQPGDEVSKINFPLLAKRAQLVFYTGWELANRDQRPVVDAKTGTAGTN